MSELASRLWELELPDSGQAERRAAQAVAALVEARHNVPRRRGERARTLRRVAIPAGALALAGVIAAAVVLATTSAPEPAGVNATPAVQHSSDAPLASAVANYAILGRPRTPADGIRSFSPDGFPFGADASEARRAPTAAGDYVYWVVPGRDGVCLVSFSPTSGGGAGCSSYTQLRSRHGAINTVGSCAHCTLPHDETAVFGLVPNGISQVRVRFKSGRSRILAARQNTFAAIVTGKPTAAIYSDGSATHTLPIASCGYNC